MKNQSQTSSILVFLGPPAWEKFSLGQKKAAKKQNMKNDLKQDFNFLGDGTSNYRFRLFIDSWTFSINDDRL